MEIIDTSLTRDLILQFVKIFGNQIIDTNAEWRLNDNNDIYEFIQNSLKWNCVSKQIEYLGYCFSEFSHT